MLQFTRKTASLLAVVGAAGLGGSAIAGAASSGTTGATGATGSAKSERQSLSAATAAKVKAAALEKVPGATVLRTQAASRDGSAYHAHIRTSGGTLQVVLIDSAFDATGVQADERRGGRGGHGGDDHEALSTANAAKVKAAALDKVPGATVLRMEAGGREGSAYHAHIRTSGGTLKVVLIDSAFKATTVQADNGRGGGRDGRGGGKGGRGGSDETALTGATKEKVEAAVKAEYPNATIIRTESNDDAAAPYESHIANGGQELEVLVSNDFKVVG